MPTNKDSICASAARCKVEKCPHHRKHLHMPTLCARHCKRDDGIQGASCVPYKEPTVAGMLCTFCKKSDVHLVGADLPMSEEHWSCPVCDSTYPITEYKKENEK